MRPFLAAWFIGYWQQRRSDTACQKYVICIGLALSSVGFGTAFIDSPLTSAVLMICQA